jgi:hypothetical protein
MLLFSLVGLGIVLFFVYKLYLFADSKSKLIKANQTGYKVSGSGLDKLYSIVWNPFARQMIWMNWKLKLGLIQPLKVGSLVPDTPLVRLNGSSCHLLKDFVNQCPPNVPLVINVGSYN